MQQYRDLVKKILDEGVPSENRTGTDTLSIFGYQMRFDLKEGFPLVTTKKVSFHNIVHELLWFLAGDTNIKYLKDNKVHIWDEWADEKGNLGPVYGKQWRGWECFAYEVDQIKQVTYSLKATPYSRRHIISAWNVADLPIEGMSPNENARQHLMALAPCHTLFQFYVRNNELSCQLYQRSCDVFLGLPYNIASYALLTHMFAKVCGYGVGEFIWTGGDTHLYENHLDQVNTQLARIPRKLPTLELTGDYEYPWEFTYDDITLFGYDPHPSISAPIAV